MAFQSPGGDFGSASVEAVFGSPERWLSFSPPEGISVLQVLKSLKA